MTAKESLEIAQKIEALGRDRILEILKSPEAERLWGGETEEFYYWTLDWAHFLKKSNGYRTE